MYKVGETLRFLGKNTGGGMIKQFPKGFRAVVVETEETSSGCRAGEFRIKIDSYDYSKLSESEKAMIVPEFVVTAWDAEHDFDITSLDQEAATLNEVITVAEAAASYMVSEDTVRKACQRGIVGAPGGIRCRQSESTYLILRKDAKMRWGHECLNCGRQIQKPNLYCNAECESIHKQVLPDLNKPIGIYADDQHPLHADNTPHQWVIEWVDDPSIVLDSDPTQRYKRKTVRCTVCNLVDW